MFEWDHEIFILAQFCTTKKSLWYTFVPEKKGVGTVLYQLFRTQKQIFLS